MTTEPSYQIGQDWEDVEVVTGISVGSIISIQNQGRAGDIIECFIGSVPPLPDISGVSIKQFEVYRLTPTEKAWVRCVRYDIQAGSTNKNRKCKAKIFIDGAIQQSSSINNDLIGGNSALTTQGFSELNSKLGNQYEVSMVFNNVTSIAPVFYGFETGSNPVILKQRDVYGGFVSATYEVFTEASYSGGDVVNAFNNNDLIINPTGVNIVSNPTVTIEGNQFSSVTSLLGSEVVGNRLQTSFGGAAGEKILKPNTKYLVKITNLLTAAVGVIAVRLYYYEGKISTTT